MDKPIINPYQIFTAASMTGTTVLTSLVTEIKRKDSVYYQLQWTGTPTGTFAVQVSADYNPGLPQTDGTQNNGTWITLPALDQTGNPPKASGAAGNAGINLNQLGAAYIRVQYTNASGTGTLNGYVTGKSLG